MHRRRAAAVALAAALCAVAPAHAAYTGPQVIDGPPSQVKGFGAIDIAPDGTGLLAYVKFDGVTDRVFVSLLEGGVWHSPVKVQTSEVPTDPASVKVGAGNAGAGVVVWTDRDSGQDLVRGARRPTGGGPFGKEVTVLDSPDDDDWRELATDMSPGGIAYASAIDADSGDVHAARMRDGLWGQVAAGLPIDAVAGEIAGPSGDGPENDIAVDAAGNAIAFFTEAGIGGTHAWARRLIATSAAPPLHFTLPTLDGKPADAPVAVGQLDVDAAADGSALLSARQSFGQFRNIVRRLAGNSLSAPVVFDGQPAIPAEPGSNGRVDISSRGATLLASERGLSRALIAGPLGGGLTNLNPANVEDPGAPRPVISDAGSGFVAFRRSGPADVVARRLDRGAFDGDRLLSNPAFGPALFPAGSVGAAIGDAGDAAFGFLQGTGPGRRIVVSGFDHPPTAPVPTTPAGALRDRTPRLSWRPSADAWGGIPIYVVLVDGKTALNTTGPAVTARRLTDGRHRYTVTAFDRLGQPTTSARATLRIDGARPKAAVKVGGTLRRGARVRLVVTVRDGRRSSGIRSIAVNFGDKRKPRTVTRKRRLKRRNAFARRYRSAGRYRLKIAVTDKAGNRTIVRKRLRITP